MNKNQIETIARVVHEANRAFCIYNNDNSQPSWDNALDWQKEATYSSIEAVLRGDTPQKLHETWMKQKLDAGWSYGKVKDANLKTHPDLIPYELLEETTKAKDKLFISIVNVMLTVIKD